MADTETRGGEDRDLYDAKQAIRDVIEAWQDTGGLPTFTSGCADEIVRVLKKAGVGYLPTMPPTLSPWSSDMSKAPRDGTRILGWGPHVKDGVVVIAWEEQHEEPSYGLWVSDRCATAFSANSFTHWAPLPPPPAGEG